MLDRDGVIAPRERDEVAPKLPATLKLGKVAFMYSWTCSRLAWATTLFKPHTLGTKNASTNLSRIELWVAGGIAAVLTGFIFYHFFFQVANAATMSEYGFKFLPGLMDGGIEAVVDFNGLGDPRPRLVTTLLTFVNIKIRQFVSAHVVMHPSFGLNWALYPLNLMLLFLVVCRLTGNQRAAAMAVLLYAASPALLDTLTNYYVPAKPLINTFILLGLLGGCLMFPCLDSEFNSRPRWGALIVFLAGLLGLLTDETAIFIHLCLPIVFCHVLWSPAIPRSSKYLFAGSLAASIAIFVILALVVFPALNTYLHQVPVDLMGTITHGCYASMLGIHPVPVDVLSNKYAPFSLLETILSVHGVPCRHVYARWTADHPMPHFHRWPRGDRLGLYFYGTLLLIPMVVLVKDRVRLGLCLRVVVAFAAFVLVETILLRPLSCWISETNYYAALASLFIALIVGLLFGCFPSSRWTGIAAWAGLCYLIGVQFSNYLDTAPRHTSIVLDPSPTPLTWKDLRYVHERVSAGHFTQVVSEHPFKSRLFAYAFELQAGRDNSGGKLIDIQPMSENSANLFGHIDLEGMHEYVGFVEGTLNQDIPPAPGEGDLKAQYASCLQGASLAELFANCVQRGRTGHWGYVRTIDKSGSIRERYWREGLLRVWADEGAAHLEDGSLAILFKVAGSERIARVYQREQVFHCYGADGRWVTSFVFEKPPPNRDERQSVR